MHSASATAPCTCPVGSHVLQNTCLAASARAWGDKAALSFPFMLGYIAVAAMVTMPRAPMIKYRLDFGKALGGAALPAAVTPVINYFLKEIISGMLVWPQRLVVPILQVRFLACGGARFRG